MSEDYHKKLQRIHKKAEAKPFKPEKPWNGSTHAKAKQDINNVGKEDANELKRIVSEGWNNAIQDKKFRKTAS